MNDSINDNEERKIVFIPSGRLGNAIFRYMGCAILNIFNPKHKYTLKNDYTIESSKFNFYKGVDYEKNDIEFMCPIKNDLSKIKEYCETNISMVGFNTLGYIKNKIDLGNLISNKYINKNNGNGIYVKNTITVTDNNFMDIFYNNNFIENSNILMDGYFQIGHIYLKNKKEILDYMEKNKNEHKIQTDRNETYFIKDILNYVVLPSDKYYDIVIHVRLGDFNGRPDFIELSYYLKLFETLLNHSIITNKHQRICILHEPINTPNDKKMIQDCLSWFKERNIKISSESNSLLIDFNIMKQCTVLVCSMSTLSWSAAYLSKHIKLCYMPNYNFFKTKYNTTTVDRSQFYFSLPIENTILYDVSTTLPKINNIKSLILTLPQYAYRLPNLDKLMQGLEKIGLRTKLFNGVYGKDIVVVDDNETQNGIGTITWNDSTYNYNKNVRLNGKQMMLGELGCLWSHINIFKELVKNGGDNNKNNNKMYYLVLEDDVELIKSLDELQDLLFHIPDDMDFCHLALSDWYPFVITQPKNDYFYECEKRFFNRTTAYIVSIKGAKKILDYIGNEINLPIDDLINTMYRTQPDFKLYVPKTYFFKERDNLSSIIHDCIK